MISRRKIAAMVLFLLMSLFMFTFANPGPTEELGEVPVITVDPLLVKIIEDTDYDVMTGVSVTDDRDTLTAEADITDTTVLAIGEHTITYTAIDNDGNEATATRTIEILDPDADEDGDNYTNQEEADENTDFDDETDFPDDNAPVIGVIPSLVKIMPAFNYNVMTGVTVTDDFDVVTVSANITDTTILPIGNNVVTYTSTEDRADQLDTATRTIRVLDPLADEDGDGYTNGEEDDADTNFDDVNEFPAYDKAPTITQNNEDEIEVFADIPSFTATATDVADGTVPVVITHNIDNTTVGTYTVTFTATDSLGNVKVLTIPFNVVDTTAPTINLVGEPYIKVILGLNDYSDQGSLVTDNYDLPRSLNGIINGNPLLFGEYTIEYNTEDAAGNVAAEVVRTIKVLDPLKDEDGDGYTNEEEYEAETDYDNVDEYPDYDKAPTITQDNEDEIEVYDSIPLFNATATDVADGEVPVVITHNIDNTIVGTYTVTFTATDSLGNARVLTMPFNVVDTTAPTFIVEGNPTLPTQNDVTLKITATDNSTFLADEAYSFDGGLTYQSNNEKVFTSNQEVIIVVKDKVGNVSLPQTISITKIDRTNPIGNINYNITTWTNGNVVATLIPSEDVIVTNNNGLFTHTFTANGTFTFNFVDEAGNTGSATATVSNIDKILPILTIKPESIGYAPYFNKVSFKLYDANLKEAVLNGTVLNKSNNAWGDVNNVSVNQYYGVAGLNTIIVRDKTGNEVTYEFYLDVTFPVITIAPYVTTPTNQDITVYATTNEGTLNHSSHTFTENGSFEFIAVDQTGNTTKKVVTITNIDKTAPTGTVSYDVTLLTNGDVVATLIPSEDVTVTNNSGLFTYAFTANGTFTFNFVDAAGNIGSATATVSNIDKALPVINLYDDNTLNNNSIVNLEFKQEFDEIYYRFKAYDVHDGVMTDLVMKTYYKFNNETDLWEVIPMIDTNVLGSYKVTYNVTDQAGNAAVTKTRYVNVSDTTPPTINTYDGSVLNHNSIVNIGLGQEFDEAYYRFKAYDVHDGVMTDLVIKTYYKFNNEIDLWEVIPMIDTNVLGSYKVTYNVTDQAGNAAVTKTRYVNVNDIIAPTGTVSYDITTLTNGNVVATLIPSEDVTVTNNGGLFTYTFTANDEFTFNFVDAAGNTGSANAIVNNIDKVAPVITLSNTNTYQMYEGDSTPTFNATALDNVDGIVVVNIVDTINNLIPETYSVTFTATDAAGNTAIVVMEFEVLEEIVVAPELISIIATLNPALYEINSTMGNLTVIAYYNNNTQSIITSGYTHTSFDSTTAGSKTMVVSYQGKTSTIYYEILPKNDKSGFIVLTNQFAPDRILVEYFAGSSVKSLYYKYSSNYYATQALIKTNIFDNASITEYPVSNVTHLTGSDYYGYINSVQTGFYYVYAKDAAGKTEGYEVIYRP